MASKVGNILEQYKCTPVYNALDSGNNRLAIEKADELIRENNAAQLARALKSVALIRIGAFADASSVCDEILKGRIEMSMIAPLSFVLPWINRLPQLAELLVAASEASPKDQELADDAIGALVKAKMYQRALQELLRRIRISKEPRYFWRYLQVSLLHARHLKPSGAKLALQVALRLANEQNIEPEYFTDETLWLYIAFHKEVGAAKLKEALEVTKNPSVQKLVDSSLTLQFLLRNCWEELEDWSAIANDCRSRILHGDRNWAVFSAFVTATIKDAGSVEDAAEVIIAAAEYDKWSKRGSYMAVLELYHASLQAGISTESICSKTSKSFVQILCGYYSRFCTKASCFEDLYPYFKKLSDEDMKQLLQVSQENCTTLANADGIQRRINAEKIILVQTDVTVDLAMSKSNELLKAYVESLANARLPDTEMQLGDDLALLAVYYLLLANKDDIRIIKFAAGIADFGCSMSKSGYKLRIILIRLLLRLGCPQLAHEHFKMLGVKAVMTDTVSHYLLDRNTTFGSDADLVEGVWTLILEPFFRASKVELPEVIQQAFSNGKFSQVVELQSFDEKLRRSFTQAQVKLDIIRAKITNDDLSELEISGALDTVESVLTLSKDGVIDDHRDISLLPSFRLQENESLFKLSQIAALRDSEWIRVMAEYLDNALRQKGSWDLTVESSSLTIAEASLLELVQSFVKSPLITNFSQGVERFFSSLENTLKTSDPFILLHTSWIIVEAHKVLMLISKQRSQPHAPVNELFATNIQPILGAIALAETQLTEDQTFSEFTTKFTTLNDYETVSALYEKIKAEFLSALSHAKKHLSSIQ